VDNECALVEEERAGVESAIAEQTTALAEACSAQREAHERRVGEVAELERALAAKRSEEAAARSALRDTEGKIASIRAKFEKQGKRLSAKAEALEADKAECAREAVELAAAKGEFAGALGRDRARERGLLRQLQANDAELATARALCSALDELGAARSALSAGAAAAASTAAGLREEVERAERAVRSNAVRKAALGAQANALQKVIDGLDAKEPQLAEEKKRAVAEKKFKEAGRLKEEGEKMLVAREKASKELGDCTSGIDGCDHDAVALEEGVAAAKAALAAAERTGDAARAVALDEAIRSAARCALALSARRAPPAIAATIGLVDAASLAPLAPAAHAAADASADASNAELCIEAPEEEGSSGRGGGGHWTSSVQVSARDMVEAERDVLVEEAVAVAGRLGRPFNLAALLAEVAAEGERETLGLRVAVGERV
jgi:chromosome segregation ATPase